MNDNPDFDMTHTYEQIIAPKLEELAAECESRGMPFAFYVVPRIHEGMNDAREFAAGEGDFVRSVTYLARNWEHMMSMVQSVSNFTQHTFGLMRNIAANQIQQDQENEDE